MRHVKNILTGLLKTNWKRRTQVFRLKWFNKQVFNMSLRLLLWSFPFILRNPYVGSCGNPYHSEMRKTLPMTNCQGDALMARTPGVHDHRRWDELGLEGHMLEIRNNWRATACDFQWQSRIPATTHQKWGVEASPRTILSDLAPLMGVNWRGK